MANIFNSVSARTPKRHKFKLNHQVKLTGEMGQLLPFFCEPVLPGDRFKLSSNQLIRFAPLIAPIMSDIDVYTHFYFVPNRIIWENWEKFITGSNNGRKLNEEEIPVPPRLQIPMQYLNKTYTGDGIDTDGKKIASSGTLLDYLGFPTVPKDYVGTRSGQDYFIDELPLRAYQRIFFDWYRDENLSSFTDFYGFIDDKKFNNGDNILTEDAKRNMFLMKLQRRAWKKDYFTSALPFAQKGDDVMIPGTGGSVDISKLSIVPEYTDKSGSLDVPYWLKVTRGWNLSSPVTLRAGRDTNTSAPDGLSYPQYDQNGSNSAFAPALKIENTGGSVGTISDGTIRELRRAMAAQKFLEREAVGGTRYIEQILSFFGVKSSDARLQRSEFLGGSKQPVVISQVLQTSESNKTALGTPAGNAVSAGGKYIFDREFEEHGFVIGIMSVIPRAEYMNGMPKKYLKRDRFDYYWPQFARIGEQPILRQELNYDFFSDETTSLNNEATFGYTPRYAEYRFINSHIHGDFKEDLSYWTLARDYGEQIPLLNESFITCNPSNRIFAYTPENDNENYNHLWIQVGLNVSALRPLPKYGESI